MATFERPTAVCIAGETASQRLLVVDAKSSSVICLGEARSLVKGGIVVTFVDAGGGEGGKEKAGVGAGEWEEKEGRGGKGGAEEEGERLL